MHVCSPKEVYKHVPTSTIHYPDTKKLHTALHNSIYTRCKMKKLAKEVHGIDVRVLLALRGRKWY